MSQPLVKFTTHTISYMIFIILIIISSIFYSSFSNLSGYGKFSDYLNEENSDFYKNYKSFTESYQLNSTNFSYPFILNDFHMRQNKPNIIDIAITIYIVGFVFQELKKVLFYNGLRESFSSSFTITTIIQIVLYISAFGLKYYTIYIVRLNQTEVIENKYWSDLDLTNRESQKKLFETVYWLNSDRYFWATLDPINMAEGFFALG